MAEVLMPRKMEIANDPSKLRSPDLLHVLAVDDSHVDRKFIERLLRVSTCKVTVVDSATKALQYIGLDVDDKSVGFEDLKVNLIMTDYSMPGMTGYELLKKIKESSAYRDIPVVVMSSENILPRVDRMLFLCSTSSLIYIEALCHGNLPEDEAVNISNIFKSSLTVEPLPSKSRHGEQITCFAQSTKLVRDVNVKNKSETNSVVELYYQIEPEAQSTRMKAMLDLFHEIIEELLFNQLEVRHNMFPYFVIHVYDDFGYRKKEQLGYVVECGPRLTYRVHGFCFCVQSSKYGPVHLLGRIDNFIKDIEGLLEEIDEESFEDYRSGMIARLLEKDPSLLSETNELWSQIVDKRYMFDFSHKEAEELRSIQKKDVIKWFKTYFGETSPKCRRVAVRVWGCNTSMKDTQTDQKSVQVITDIVAFKSTCQFYPSLC